jgi:ABC-2 type transport system ATP-binding protein
MEDIDQICDRIILIDKGEKLIDEPLSAFKQRYNDEYYVEVEYPQGAPIISDERIFQTSQTNNKVLYKSSRSNISVKEVMRYFIDSFDIADITVRNQRLDEIVRTYYHTFKKEG